MEPVIDFLAEAELKEAEQRVMQIFDVKQARPCHPVISKDARKARKAGKHERIAKLVVSLQAKAAGAGR
jgi:hypothetical protein